MKLFWKNIGKNSYALLLPVFLFLSTLLIGGSVKAAAVKPDQRVWESLFQLEDIRSLSFSGSVSYAGKARASFTDLLVDPNVLNKKTTPKYETVIVDFNGGNQILTPTESQSWFTFSTKTSDKKAPSFGIEVRSVGGKAYVAITGGTNLPAELSGYLNTWVQLDFDWLLKDLNLGALLANKTGVQNRSDAEKAEMQRMRSAILKSKTLTIRSKNIQKINGVYFDVYSFSVNKNNLKK